MSTNQLPIWLLKSFFFGSEGEGEGGDGDGSGEGGNGESNEDGSTGSESEGGEGDSGDGEDDRAELKNALAAERARAKRLERENNRLKRKKDSTDDADTQKEQKDLEKAQQDKAKSDEKVQRLATRLLNGERDAAIVREATKLKFIDPTDALTDDIRRAIEFDQDDDDPSDIEIDESTVARAVKKLADTKKHLITPPNNGNPSGSRFGTNPGDKTDGLDLTNYPSLAG